MLYYIYFYIMMERGGRVSHSDIWKHILRWLRLFIDSPDRNVKVTHVKAHVGVFGNERADELAKEGVKLRFQLTEGLPRGDVIVGLISNK